MTTSVKRRTRSAKNRSPRHSPSEWKLAWIWAVFGLALAGGVSVAAGFALDVWGSQRRDHAERLATPIPAAVTPAPSPKSDSTPAAVIPVVPATVNSEDPKPEPPVSLPVPDPAPQSVPAPTAEAPAMAATAPPRAVVSESDLRRQLQQFPEVGLKPADAGRARRVVQDELPVQRHHGPEAGFRPDPSSCRECPPPGNCRSADSPSAS